MKLVDIIRAEKTGLSHGQWGEDKIRAKDFPVSKKRGKAYPLTRRWRWRISKLEACGTNFRLMAAYHMLVPEFSAILAEDVSGDSRIIARLEFHESHDGWHVHSFCGEIASATVGIVKPFGTMRIPEAYGYHRHTNMLANGSVMTDVAAAAIVASFFRIPDNPDLFSGEALPWKA